MSWLSKAIKGVGKVVKKVASPVINTVAGLIPGGSLIKTGVETVVGVVKQEQAKSGGNSSFWETIKTLGEARAAGLTREAIEGVGAALQAAETKIAVQSNVTEVSEFVNANKWIIPMVLGGGALIYLVARRR